MFVWGKTEIQCKIVSADLQFFKLGYKPSSQDFYFFTHLSLNSFEVLKYKILRELFAINGFRFAFALELNYMSSLLIFLG